MIAFNDKKNVLMECEYKYTLQDRESGNLYRDMFPYEEVPKCTFNFRLTPANPPEQIWITDTTFRDGQQSRAPYEPEQIRDLYSLLHRLGGPKGIIRQTEFFLYSERDRKALDMCRELGYEFPEITGWIRASKKDFQLARELGLRECGILVSCSDYHIYKKLKMTRRQAADMYLGVIKDALDAGIHPRCHFEDITRADFYGFVVPFAHEIHDLADESGIPIKIRACDTMGYGVPYRRRAHAAQRRRYNLRPAQLRRLLRRAARVARPQRLLQGRSQLRHRLAIRRGERELLAAGHRRADGEHPARGNGHRVRPDTRHA